MRRPFLSAVLLVLIAAAHPSPGAGQSGQREVESVRFEGNRAFPSDSLARAIVTRETECRSAVLAPFCWSGADFSIERYFFRARELPRDSLRLKIWYQDRGYREAVVLPDTLGGTERGVTVMFTVNEGRPVLVDTVEFLGLEGVRAPELLEDLPVQRGDPLSYFNLNATRDTLARRLANQGHARVEVLRSSFIPRDDPYRARVTFSVAPGPRARYGHVSVEGASLLAESTVLRTLEFRSGDTYRVDQIIDAQARLFGLEIIRSATVQPDFESGPDSVIPINVRIQEGDLHRVRTGGGWSTSECFDVDASWVSRNFTGGGRRLQVRGRVSNILAPDLKDLLCPQSGDDDFAKLNWLTSVDFIQPWIFSTRNSFQASIFAERQSLPDVYIRKAVGLSLALTRAIGPRSPLTVSYRPELSELDAAEILFCTSFLVCAPEDIQALQERNLLAPVGLSFSRVTTNNVLNPSGGYSLLLGLEHAASWTGSAFPYNRLVADVSRYDRLAPGLVLAGRLRSGLVVAGEFEQLTGRQPDTDIVHPEKRFYAGGANSVRGFSQSALGPRVLTTDVENILVAGGCDPEQVIDLTCDASGVDENRFDARPTGGTRVLEGSLELRFPVSSSFEAAAFTDVGQVWPDGMAVDLGDLEVTPGFGVRYLSPIGPLRVDVAYRFRGGQELPVVTNQLERFVQGQDDPDARIVVDGSPIPYLQTETLAVLGPPVLYDDSPGLSLRRFQLHISIGQAF